MSTREARRSFARTEAPALIPQGIRVLSSLSGMRPAQACPIGSQLRGRMLEHLRPAEPHASPPRQPTARGARDLSIA